MNPARNIESHISCTAGIAFSATLAAWVIYAASSSGSAPGSLLYFSMGAIAVCAVTAVLVCKSFCSGAVVCACTSLIVAGSMTGFLLGRSEESIALKGIFAGIVLVLSCCLFNRLLKLLEFRWFLIGAASLSVAVYVVTLLLAKRTGGAALGIDIFGNTIQIFELGKPLYIIVTAAVLCINDLRPSSKLLITLGFTLLHCLLLLAQSELGTMLCILAAYFGQLAVWLNEPAAALRAAFWDKGRKFVFVPALCAVIGAAVLILSVYPFIIDKALQRIDGWINGTYQINCGMDAMVNGGWLGAAGKDLVYIPYADSDMVFPSLIQLFGLAAAVAVVMVFISACTSVISTARSLRSTIVCSVAVGSVVMLTMQAIIAICASTGLMPMTGITLPFVSNGGMSLAVCAGFAGIIASAVKKTKEMSRP